MKLGGVFWAFALLMFCLSGGASGQTRTESRNAVFKTVDAGCNEWLVSREHECVVMRIYSSGGDVLIAGPTLRTAVCGKKILRCRETIICGCIDAGTYTEVD